MAMRKDDRLETRRPTRARFPTSEVEVVLLDLSTAGCRIETDNEFAQVGATIVLTLLAEHEAAGQIAWRRDGECGVRFYKEVSTLVIDQVGAAPT